MLMTQDGNVTTVSIFVNNIITNCTASSPVPAETIPDRGCTLHLVNNLPLNVAVKRIYELSFWNDTEGYFSVLESVGSNVNDLRRTKYDLPDIKLNKAFTYHTYPKFVEGDMFLDEDYMIYKVVKEAL